jgi:ABC-type nitrate/sulfonate/bicarbonate transport system substrate-binding protein
MLPSNRFHLLFQLWLACGLLPAAAHAQSKPVVLGVPGIPPVFSGLQAFVAEREGFFKKHNVEVQVRPFDTGVAAARAVASGDIDSSLSPTPVVINMIANANVPVVSIYGQEHPDWLIATSDPQIKTCKDLVGQPVGVDTPGGARSVALLQMVSPPPCGIKLEQLQQVGLGSNTSAAMVAGQIKTGVLHIDDQAVIEENLKKPLAVVITLKDVKPVSHYNFLAVRSDRLAADRARFVSMLAALIEATDFMYDPKNIDRIAEIATVTGRTQSQAKDSIGKYLPMEFWPRSDDGLKQPNVEAEIRTQAAVGGIQAGKEVPGYGKIVDHSVYRDALAIVRKSN